MAHDEFSITVEKAEQLYSKTVALVDEDLPQINIQMCGYLLRDEVDFIIKQVLAETGLTMKLKDFQRLTLHYLENKKNVVLFSPTESGKMLCAYLTPLVFRQVFIKEKSVGMSTMSLSALMDEKQKSELLIVIMMQGGLESKESIDACLSAI